MGSEKKGGLPKKGSKSRAAQRLVSQISKGLDQTTRQKVAHTLNHFPAARDSDITLIIRLLHTFHSDVIDSEGRMALNSMYELPKFYDTQRERARIQNQYGLFLASPEVQAYRKNHQYAKAEEFASTKPDFNSVWVFTDESGKDQPYFVFGSLWIYSPTEHIGLLKALNSWRENQQYFDEFHFKDINSREKAELALEFFRIIIQSGCYYSFKGLLVNRRGVNSSRLIDAMYEGITQMLIKGIRSEITGGRVTPPLRIHLAKDADPATDILKLADLNVRTVSAFKALFPNEEATLESVSNPGSEKDNLIQIVDLFTASVGRWRNQGVPVSMDKPKEYVAREIANMLNFRIDDKGKIKRLSDVCNLEYLSPNVEVFRKRT